MSPLLPPPPTPRGDALFSLHNNQRDLPLSLRQARKTALALAQFLKMNSWQIGIAFVTRRASARLHATHFNDPTATDCMTFPLGDKCGDVALCPAIALEFASSHKGDPYEELTLYLVHTFLHLLGFRDTTPSEQRAMRKKEKTCMRYLKDQTCILSPFSSPRSS